MGREAGGEGGARVALHMLMPMFACGRPRASCAATARLSHYRLAKLSLAVRKLVKITALADNCLGPA